MGRVDSLQGRLLIAGANLLDPNFRRTVVLVGEHNDEGALGVVLNRPSDLTVMEVVPLLAPFAGPDERLFIGGPVQPTSAVLLAEFDDSEHAGLMVFGQVGFLMGDVDEDAATWVRRARVFAGYAGWGPGQLEAEVANGVLDPGAGPSRGRVRAAAREAVDRRPQAEGFEVRAALHDARGPIPELTATAERGPPQTGPPASDTLRR